MASWKQYGGRHYQDTNNFFHASGITCDDLTILNAYNGSLDINGSLTVSGNVVIGGNIDLCSNLILSNLTIRENATVQGNLEILQNLVVDSTIRFGNPLQGSLVVEPSGSLFWDVSAGPLTISGAGPDVFSIVATGPVCQTVLGKNAGGRGVSLVVDASNQYFRFYGDVSGRVDASVSYIHRTGSLNSLVLDVCGGQVYAPPYLVVGSSPVRSGLGEQQTLYDVSSGSLFPDVYSLDINQGQGLSVLNSSGNGATTVSLMNGVSASHGLTLVGGVFPNDLSRSFGFASASADGFAPSLSMVSGNTLVNASTVGINTYAPTTDTCVIDINGPVRIHHGEVHHTYTTSFAILDTGYNGSTFVSIGAPVLVSSRNVHYALVSNDSMVSWTAYPIDFSYNNSSVSYQAVYVDTSFVFVGGNQDLLFYSNNQGRNWYNIQTYDSGITFKSIYSTLVSPSILRVYGTYTNTTSVSIPSTTYIDISLNVLQAGGDISIPFSSYRNFYDTTVLRNLHISGNGTYIYTLGPSRANPVNTLFQKYDLSMNPLSSLNFSTPLNNLQVFPTGIVLLGGNNYFYSRSFSPTLLTDFSSNNVLPSSVSLTSCYWYDLSRSVLVGQDSYGSVGAFYYSDNGLATFRSVPESIINEQGNAGQLLRYGLTDVWMTGLGSFLIGALYRSSLHQYFSVELPDIFDPLDNPVLNIAGRVDICGNVYVANLFGVDASFGNFAVGTLQVDDISASHISVSLFDASSGRFGTAEVYGALGVGGLLDASSALIENVLTTPFLQVSQESALYGNLAVGQNLVVGGQVSATSLSNFGPLQQLGDMYVQNNVFINQNMLIQGTFGAASANILENLYVSGYLLPPQAYNTNSESIAIGLNAGVSQSLESISIGFQAGQTNQQPGTIAIGTTAGNSLQGSGSIAMGTSAGAVNQGPGSLALGNNSGNSLQGSGSIALGSFAGEISQGSGSIALGVSAGESNQSNNSIAIGSSAGGSAQGSGCIAIGSSSGNVGQGQGSIAFGTNAGEFNQGVGSMAFGFNAGNDGQQAGSIAFGANAGAITQGTGSIAFGPGAGMFEQQTNAIAFGSSAGLQNQGERSVAIGNSSGRISQGTLCLAVGDASGLKSQANFATAIGSSAGRNNQGDSAIAIGNDCARDDQGRAAIAIGTNAVQANQSENSICLNATQNPIDVSNQGLYIQPIRGPITTSNTLFYDPSGGEITYGSGGGGGVLSYVSEVNPIGVDLSQNYYNNSYFDLVPVPGETYSTVVYDCSFNPGYYIINMTVYLLVVNAGFSMDSMGLSMSSDPSEFHSNLLAPLETRYNYGFVCVNPGTPELFSIQLSSVVHFTVATHAYFNFSIYKNGGGEITTAPITGPPQPIQISYNFTQIG
jgi:hypothetical protein